MPANCASRPLYGGVFHVTHIHVTPQSDTLAILSCITHPSAITILARAAACHCTTVTTRRLLPVTSTSISLSLTLPARIPPAHPLHARSPPSSPSGHPTACSISAASATLCSHSSSVTLVHSLSHSHPSSLSTSSSHSSTTSSTLLRSLSHSSTSRSQSHASPSISPVPPPSFSVTLYTFYIFVSAVPLTTIGVTREGKGLKGDFGVSPAVAGAQSQRRAPL